MRRPTPDELQAAGRAGTAIPDTIGPDLDLLFVGINPGLYSGATGHHFARPGNRFWPTLHGAGLTPKQLSPDEPHALLALGIGITNIVNRTTATAAELSPTEIRAGGQRLRDTVRRYRPRIVAILGVTTYRVAFDRPKAAIGRQPETVEGAALWVLPNPSGLNAHYQLPRLIELFGELRAALEEVRRERPNGSGAPGPSDAND